VTFSLNTFNSDQSFLQAAPAKRDYIYWTPTTANIVDNPYSYTTSTPFSQLVTPYTYQAYPSYYQTNGISISNTPVPYGTGYYYSPGNTWYYYGRKEPASVQSNQIPLNNDTKKENSLSFRKNGFQDVINDIKSLKNEIFGNPDADMAFYKKNKNAYYDSQWLVRAQKISKILELEELLEFYNKNNNNDNINVQTKIEKKEAAKESKPIETKPDISTSNIKIEKKEIQKEIKQEVKPNVEKKETPKVNKLVENKRVSLENKENKKAEESANNIEITVKSNDKVTNSKEEKINNLRKN